MGQDQLAAPALGGDDDGPRQAPLGNAGVLDPDHALFEIHHQPLAIERVDPDHAVAADVPFLQGGKLQVGDGAWPDGQLVDLDAVDDDIVGGHGVKHARRAERQLQVARDAQSDRRSCRRRCRR